MALVAARDLCAASAEQIPRGVRSAASTRRRRWRRCGCDPSARIFTNDEWGDYLIWRLYPHTQVFVDGRSDFYGDDFEDKYLDVMNVKYGWEKTLARFGVDTILMPPDAPLTGALKESSRWRVVYDDGIALVFRSERPTVGEPDFRRRNTRRNRP